MQQIGRNVFSMGLSRVISGLIIFVVYIKLVTYLGPSEFGKFSLVLTYYIIFSLLLDFGISKYAIKKMSEDMGSSRKFMGNFFFAQFIISVAILVFFIVIPKILDYDPDVSYAMVLAGIGLFVSSMQNPLSALLQARQKMHILASVIFVHTIINAIWLLALIYTRQNFVFAFWLYIISGVVGFVIYLLATGESLASHLPKKEILEKNLIARMIIYGIPFAFVASFEILIAKADSIVQKFFLPYSDVGLYAGAYRFVDALTFVPAVIFTALFPYIASKANLQSPDVVSSVERWNRYLIMLAVPLGVGGALLSDKIVLTLFDARYAGSIRSFQILIWATVITYIYAVPNVIMIVKKTRASLKILSLVAVLNIAANFILVPYFGIIASAWLTVLSYFLVAVFYIAGARKLTNFSLWRPALFPVLASIPMGLVVWNMREINFFYTVTAGVVIYFVLLTGVGFLKREDWIFFRTIFQRY